MALVLVALVGPACSGEPPSAQDEDAPATDLVADFTYEPDYEATGPTSCPLRDIQFTDESAGDPETWDWSFMAFGDETTSTEPDPRVTTRLTEATLTVTRGDETDSVTKEIQTVEC
jgi:PKD repeat protein